MAVSFRLSAVSRQTIKMHKFRKLEVWQRAIDFTTTIYALTVTFPKEEKFGLVDQIRRATVSIALNIAEGSGSGSDPEFGRFLRMAQRSAYEVIAALEIARNLDMISKEDADVAINEVDQISAMIGGLLRSLKADS